MELEFQAIEEEEKQNQSNNCQSNNILSNNELEQQNFVEVEDPFAIFDNVEDDFDELMIQSERDEDQD